MAQTNGTTKVNGVAKTDDLAYTEVEQITKIVAKSREAFLTLRTKDIEYRKKQLRKLYWAIHDHEEQFVEASKYDLNKPAFEVIQTETGFVKAEIINILKNIDSWAKDEKAPGIPFTMSFLNGKILKEPYGTVLVIGPFNYPLMCTIGPLVGAIAAGNTAVIKFSERMPRCASVMQKMIELALDRDAYSVVQGAIPQTQALLAEKWDKIFFTGSAGVGKIVAKAAAEHLTPVTLELGGRNPAIVTKNADIRLAARRLLWGKSMNAGQACISQNYVLVEESVLPKLIDEFKKVYLEYFPKGTESPDTADVTHLIPGSLPRIKNLLNQSTGEIILGGHMDLEKSYLAPTVILAKDSSDPIINEETFAPVITLLPFDNLTSALKTVNTIHRTPLALYPFTSNSAELSQILKGTTSGGVTINDTMIHGGLPSLEFGGIGDSGIGSYRGKASFDCFTHRRPVVKTPGFLEGVVGGMRYPPYTTAKLRRMKQTSELGATPDFDREGNKRLGWTFWLFSIGTGRANIAQVVLGAVVTALIAFALRQRAA